MGAIISNSGTGMGPIKDEVNGVIDAFQSAADEYGSRAEAAFGSEPEDSGSPPTIAVISVNKPSSIVSDVGIVPIAPTLSTINAPNIERPADVDPYEAPREPTVTADYSFETRATRPGAAPKLTASAPTVSTLSIDRPEESDVPLPSELASFTAQSLTPISTRSFSVASPQTRLPSSLSPAFAFKEADPYSLDIRQGAESRLLETITQLKSALEGRGVIPRSVWDDYWLRNTSNLGRSKREAFREADREHASRGWALPGGAMLARRQAAKWNYENEVSKSRNEQTTAGLRLANEDMYKAIELTLSLRKTIADVDSQLNERALRAAGMSVESEINAYNASVALYNATIAAAQVSVASNRLELDLVLGSVEAMRAKVEEERVRGEFDANKVSMYQADIEHAKLRLQEYAEWVTGLQAKVESQKTAVMLYGERVKGFEADVGRFRAEWDGYGKQLEEANTRISAFNAQVGLSEQRVNAAQVLGQHAQWKLQGDLDIEKLLVESANLDLNKYRIESEHLNAFQMAKANVFNTSSAVFQTIQGTKAANVTAALEQYKANIELARVDLEGRIETARQQLAHWSASTNAALEWKQRKGAVLATLGGSAYTAANISMSAGVDFSYSESQSISYSESQSRSDSTSLNGSITLDSGGFVQVSPRTPTLPTLETT